jgi:hypothetical protein
VTDRALLTTLHQTQSAFERQRGIAVGHEGQVLSLSRSAPATAHVPPCAPPGLPDPGHHAPEAGAGNGPRSTLRTSRDASGPALLFIQAEIGAVVRGLKAGEFDYPT